MGESVVEATITRWLKPEGAAVVAGEPLVELETDKVNVEVQAESSGVLQQILKKEGDTVAVHEVLGLVAEQGAVPASRPAPSVEKAAPEPQPASAEAVPTAPENGRSKVAATPVAQRLASENGLDLAQVKGSGPGGKVTKEDVEAHLSRASAPVSIAEPPPVRTEEPRPAPAPTLPTPDWKPTVPSPAERVPQPIASERSAPAFAIPGLTAANGRREEREPMSRLRQTIAERLVEAQRTAAMLTTFNEVDMSAVMEVRKRRRDSFKERHGVGLGFMSFFTKAAVGALKAFPVLNAEIQGKEIIRKFYYDIGIAVGTEKGLVVPVVRDADRKTFAELEKDIADLATRAREGKLTLPELTGGTFTITNGGIYGSLMSTPILNAPQVGILGMHKIEERPVALNGEVAIRPMMYLALSYDHRIVDGSEAVRFLVRIKELIEDPETLLLEG
jgi:2-oxoglutarate dehydrogenase E2 component (dihydrolipoamide succinyltransferase)